MVVSFVTSHLSLQFFYSIMLHIVEYDQYERYKIFVKMALFSNFI